MLTGRSARLDGVGSILPNPGLFVAMYVRQEAVLSSQIERTQSTLEDILQFEVDAKGVDIPKDVEEVVNYVRAMKDVRGMNHGLRRMEELDSNAQAPSPFHRDRKATLFYATTSRNIPPVQSPAVSQHTELLSGSWDAPARCKQIR